MSTVPVPTRPQWWIGPEKAAVRDAIYTFVLSDRHFEAFFVRLTRHHRRRRCSLRFSPPRNPPASA